MAKRDKKTVIKAASDAWAGNEAYSVRNRAFIALYGVVGSLTKTREIDWGDINFSTCELLPKGYEFRRKSIGTFALPENVMTELNAWLKCLWQVCDNEQVCFPECLFPHVSTGYRTIHIERRGGHKRMVRMGNQEPQRILRETAEFELERILRVKQDQYLQLACGQITRLVRDIIAEREDREFRDTILCSD